MKLSLRIDTQNADVKKPFVWLATWFGAGFINPAPGTWGSLAAIPFGLLLFKLGGLIALGAGIILVTIIGVWAANKYQKHTSIHDSKAVVIDEVAGQWIALLPVLHSFGIDLFWIVIACALFRLFDIWKPYPVSYFDQKMDNAYGVMGDDLVAGLYAALVIIGVIYAGLG